MKGVSSGSGGRANRVMREGNSFPLVFVCFQVVLA